MAFGPVEFADVMIALGVFVVGSCVADWNLFFSSRKALVPLLGRARARAFWGAIGVAMIGFGAACLLGLVHLPAPK